jgi:hypothetical protein
MTETNSMCSIAAPPSARSKRRPTLSRSASEIAGGAAARTCASVSLSATRNRTTAPASAFSARPDPQSTRRKKTATADGDQELCDCGLEDTV